ncbi:MAG: AlpA family phage regulatory protein [Magnetococcales bacterium]|nr:AlpA family phage regulatory protein [Magnetococcales bacterium]
MGASECPQLRRSRSVQLSERTVGWRSSDVRQWLASLKPVK